MCLFDCLLVRVWFLYINYNSKNSHTLLDDCSTIVIVMR
nr:MAG TPA: hypothetical protein [Crassvirales sp.]